MDLIRRMGIFLVGLSLGIILVSFFFKGKGVEICYLPNCRVLKDLRSKPIDMSKQVHNPSAFTIAEISPAFKNGEVDFQNSNTQSKPCKTYFLEGDTPNGRLRIGVENCPTQVMVLSIEKL